MADRAMALMVLGAASGVGKTTVALGIARALARGGLRTAPFKALNITDRLCRLPDGRLMALSQVVAALACGADPVPDMNPFAIAVRGEASDVVVAGERRPIGYFTNMALEARRRVADDAYGRVRRMAGAVVVEGSGAAAEVNLRARDIANMDFALRWSMPSILVVDASRGGAFAAAFGTLALLAEDERALVRGIVVNRFEGSRESVREMACAMEACAGLPVLGVLPPAVFHLPAEDGLDDSVGENVGGAEFELDRAFARRVVGQSDAVADMVERHLDMAAVRRAMEWGTHV